MVKAVASVATAVVVAATAVAKVAAVASAVAIAAVALVNRSDPRFIRHPGTILVVNKI